MNYTIDFKIHLADTLTPVDLYLRLRDRYPMSLLLESSDYTHEEGKLSMICVEPIRTFEVLNSSIKVYNERRLEHESIVDDKRKILSQLELFLNGFKREDDVQLPFYFDGIYGYTSYDAVQYFEDINLAERSKKIPDLSYSFYRLVIVFDHLKHQIYIIENVEVGKKSVLTERIMPLLQIGDTPRYSFFKKSIENSNMTDDEFKSLVGKAQKHCARGDVFQIVLSRAFSQAFYGDEFNVYRALRQINPSPYMYFFDMGDFNILGSSPEAQIIIENNRATITPIAGTYRRTGEDKEDRRQAALLLADPKEKAEHTMLVDLARNDLSRQGDDVQIEELEGIQMYSHVIHIVSKISARLNGSSLKMYAETFPAGTLSGAPKYRAMQLIDQYEPTPREYYGGAIGFLGFNGNVHQAILIRSALCKNGILYYQAGAGVVIKSNADSECDEVMHKTDAIRSAIEAATMINKNGGQ